MPAHPGSFRTAIRTALLGTAALLITSCGTPGVTAAPVTTSATTSSSAPAAPATSGPPVTVPGLDSTVPSSTTPSSATPSAEPAPPTTAAPAPTVESTTAPEPVASSEPSTPAPEPVTPPTTAAPAPTTAPAPAPPRADGAVVVVDAGHNGANGANPSIINALVDAGFGQTKPCNTTGTSTNDGYSEARFNFGVAQYLVPMLEAEGITVVTTRDSNDGVGPCVDRRAAIGNDAQADAVVSIHGDGDDASAEGFYVMTAQQDPAGAGVAAESAQLAVAVRDGLAGTGLSPSNHLGSDGLWQRGDLAGLNLSVRPTVMIEAGNMRNATDAALMSSAEGQRQVARGLADGVLAYLAAAG
ncbi:N-acetylmuramoyl-L-alanine amidase [Nakamurella flavida]|uniref:N-acetylmuramoyl-L-alanine amidase n=1 Tax=Nakamurella flavida TaxID=363630 RepID=A0A939C5L4_9ACTN|nr:N-acetylmuramoyl-L-alanine amidase [Nakamurella flavida]MBM9476312.1 N-acetylmuramoyl-L-alanine amidase [Nakamurella flavida]MDP9779588.1 N-acetylmuramoyl-L-alanine amidase [Nakamurella flavida]